MATCGRSKPLYKLERYRQRLSEILGNREIFQSIPRRTRSIQTRRFPPIVNDSRKNLINNSFKFFLSFQTCNAGLLSAVTVNPPPGGEYSHILAIRVGAAGEGMVFKPFGLVKGMVFKPFGLVKGMVFKLFGLV